MNDNRAYKDKDIVMERRRLGRTEHLSTVVIFGGASLWKISQRDADRTIKTILDYGVNHIDVAPQYGAAEVRIGPWMKKIRKEVFLGCKTLERTRKGAFRDLHRSLKRLKVDYFDLYQLHGVNKMSEIREALGPNGAMEAIIKARDDGLLRFIGITGHDISLQIEALGQFDFDTAMFPLNFIMYSKDKYRIDYSTLIGILKEKDIGVITIKAIAKGNWEPRLQELPFDKRPYSTWYEPFSDQRMIDESLRFVLSQDISCTVIAGDIKLIPIILDSAEQYKPMSEAKQTKLLKSAQEFRQLCFIE